MQRPLFQFPGQRHRLARTLDVKIAAGVDRAVDLRQKIQIGRLDGPDFHRAGFRVTENRQAPHFSIAPGGGNPQNAAIILLPMSSDSATPPPTDPPQTFFDLYRSQKSRPAARPSVPTPPVVGGDAAPRRDGRPPPLTVSQLTRMIDGAIRSGLPATVSVKGELSSYKPHASSGHHYFTLKDTGSCIDGVFWKDAAARLKFLPKVGMEVVITGRIQVWTVGGKYQLYANELYPIGQGCWNWPSGN